jgi:hypothetical protein
MKLTNPFKPWRLSFNLSFPIVLLGIAVITYGLFIPWLGFYLDDWYIVWFRHFFGSSAFTEFFSQDRPFLSWIYIVLTPLMGDSPITWQIFAVFTRWILGLAFWDLLKQIWPEYKFEAAVGALLYTVFPGFQFHWFSVQYSQVYLIEAGMLFSLSCSIRAPRAKHRAWLWILVGLPTGIYGLFSVEYHFGLELLRPVLIWLALAGTGLTFWRRLNRFAWHWFPYFISLVVFTIWRVFLFQSFMYEITLLDEISVSPINSFWSLITTTLHELVIALLFVWGRLFDTSIYTLSGKILFLTLAIAILVFTFLLIAFLALSKERKTTSNCYRWNLTTILLGLIGTFLTLIPFKAAGLPANLDFPWNRFMIVLGLGSVIFTVGVISFLPRRWLKATVAALLLTLSITSQINTANQFRLAWEDQKKLFWQLTWRVPGLDPNTMLVTDSLRFAQYYSGTSLSAPLNWIYAPNLSTRQTPYQLVMLDTPQIDTSHSLQPDTPVKIEYRSFSFSGNSDQSIFFLFNSTDCLQVLSPTTTTQRMLTNFHDPLFLKSIPLSDLSLIKVDPVNPVTPPTGLFGQEPGHNWCYYYLKADLTRQQGDWAAVLDWYAQAEEQGFTSQQDPEMYPKIEALAMTDHWQSARNLTDELLAGDPFLNRGLCAIWERSVENNPPQGTDRDLAVELVDLLQCPELKEVLR